MAWLEGDFHPILFVFFKEFWNLGDEPFSTKYFEG